MLLQYTGGLEELVLQDLGSRTKASLSRRNIALNVKTPATATTDEYTVLPNAGSDYSGQAVIAHAAKFPLSTLFANVQPVVPHVRGTAYSLAVWKALTQIGIHEVLPSTIGLNGVPVANETRALTPNGVTCPMVISSVTLKIVHLDTNDVEGYLNCYSVPRLLGSVSGLGYDNAQRAEALYPDAGTAALNIAAAIMGVFGRWDSDDTDKATIGARAGWFTEDVVSYLDSFLTTTAAEDVPASWLAYNDRGYFRLRINWPETVNDLARPASWPAKVTLTWYDRFMVGK